VSRPGLAVVALVAAVLAGCDGGAADLDGNPADVAACDDLRERENELIDVANDVLGRLADAGDDAARRDAIAAGFDDLVAVLEAQRVGEVEPAVRDALVAGAEAAVAELEDERSRFLAAHPQGVSPEDERGVAGELQTAVEKAFSDLEPSRAAYRDAGLDAATDADPDCRFVTQRGDPAAG